ncbi:MAG: hypothetical protein M3R38_19410 [Actinomycetota bacterium]|nr:hypothetical protein [Actinomycetota bacterium]
MSRTYEPAEGRRGVRATLALMAVLAVLSALLLAVVPGPSGREIALSRAPGGLLSGSDDAQEEEKDVETPAVAAAVEDFSEAYNYSGSWGDELKVQIEPHVTASFWSSPRGSQNARDFAAIDSYVLQQTWLLAWEPVEVGPEGARGYATRGFHVESEAGTQDYQIRHELRLVKELGYWKVAWAGEPTEEGV